MSILVDLAEELVREARQIESTAQFVIHGGMDLRPLVERVSWKAWRPPQGQYEERPFSAVLAAWTGQIQSAVVRPESRPPLLAELDQWPRNAFTKSWETMAIQTTLSAFLGFDAALFWAGLGYRDHGFAKFCARHRAWFEAVRETVLDHSTQMGIAVPVDDARPRLGASVLALGRMGLPIRFVPSREWRKETLLALLSPCDLPDDFCAQGKALVCDTAVLLKFGNRIYDGTLKRSEQMFSAERMTTDPLNGAGSGLYSTALLFLQEADMYTLEASPTLRVLSEYVDSQSEPLCPCVALNEERQILIVNQSSAAWERLISQWKAEQLRNALTQLCGGPLPVCLVGGTDTFVFARESPSHRVVLVVNLSLDPALGWRLQFDRPVTSSQLLDRTGKWRLLPAGECPVRNVAPNLPSRSMQCFRFELT